MLRSQQLYFLTNVSGKPIGPVFKGQESKKKASDPSTQVYIRKGLENLSNLIVNKSTVLSFFTIFQTHYYQPHKPLILGQILFVLLEPWVSGLNPTLDIDVIPLLCVLFRVVGRGLAIGRWPVQELLPNI
jgi:hypothetical protein